MLEEINKVLPALGTVVSGAQFAGGPRHRAAGATTEQRREFLPRLASGEWLGAYALSEAHAGSDPAAMRTSAVRRRRRLRHQRHQDLDHQRRAARTCSSSLPSPTSTVKPSRGISAFICPKTRPA